MPFNFTLPTTSTFSFAQHFTSSTHPSLLLAATTHRSVVRDALKKHKRLAPASHPAHLPTVLDALNEYLPYVLTLRSALSSGTVSGVPVALTTTSTPLSFEWRPTLSSPSPGRPEPARLKLSHLDAEVLFVLTTTAYVYTLLSTTALSASQPNYQIVTKHLLTAASFHKHISTTILPLPPPSPKTSTPELHPQTHTALSSLALSSATLLAIAKDDPYPSLTKPSANPTDYLIAAPPPPPHVRALLLARLCIAASAHAATAAASLSSLQKPLPALPAYATSLSRAAKARACRFLGLDAERTGEVGTALGYLSAARTCLPSSSSTSSSSSSKLLTKPLRKDSTASSGPATAREEVEERRVLAFLEQKWSKTNDTVFNQRVAEREPLLAGLPGGREVCVVPKWDTLGGGVLAGEVLGELKGMATEDGEGIGGVGGEEEEEDSGEESDGDGGGGAGKGKVPGGWEGGGNVYY
ncbi:MAG: hypothetical protein M1833_003006 [Piccolia ochrophora]|nr:MAG: hypothetical protein M1833_003006 [Piccolia ochrophora]